MTVYAKNCVKQLSKFVEIVDIVDTVYTGPDSAFSCGTELTVFFDANFDDELPDRLAPKYEWHFDDSVILYGNPASRTFYSSGSYSYQLLITFGQSNCMRTSFNTIEVLVPDFPTAEFEPNPQTVSYGEEIQFIDKSVSGDGKLVYWYWNFGDSTESELQNPTHNYLTTSGYMTVLLWIEDEYGCADSISHEVLILESLEFPNIFSPVGSDGKRYFFRPLEEKGYFKDFEIVIYDRWGNFVWKNSCTDPNCPDYYNDSFWWDGTNKFGKPVSSGVYFWVVKATPLSADKPLLKNGSVTVVGK
jgi:PKD repeat protein